MSEQDNTSVPATTTAATPQLNPRRAAMAAIAQQAHAKEAPNMAQFDEDTGEVLGQQAVPQEVDEPAQVEQTPAAETKPVEAVAEPPQKRIVSIVVDGQKIDVDEDRVLEAGRRTLQKESAADRRLAEANEILRQAKTRASQRDPVPQAQELAPSQDAPQVTQGQPIADLATVERMMEQRLYHRDATRAAQQFKSEFPDIAGDDYLMSIAAQMEDKRLNEAAALGEPLGDPGEAYRKHGETIRQWAASKGLKTQGQVQAAAQEAPSRQEAKRQIVAVPGVNARAPLVAEKKPKTVAEQIEEMRLKRGQASATKR